MRTARVRANTSIGSATRANSTTRDRARAEMFMTRNGSYDYSDERAESIPSSVREGVQHDVHAKRVPGRRELEEEFAILAFAFPRVADVRVVRHQHHDAVLRVRDHPEVGMRAV